MLQRMHRFRERSWIPVKQTLSDFSMLGALLVLCAFFAWRTWDVQQPTGAAAGKQVGNLLRKQWAQGGGVLIAVRDVEEDHQFAEALTNQLAGSSIRVVEVVTGQPIDARKAIARCVDRGIIPDAIACSPVSAAWAVFQNLETKSPTLAKTSVVQPQSYHWPNFLKVNNLLNVANQIVVIAIIAIGMTLVIITGGIDLSVGSLVALSAVVSTWFIAGWGGGIRAGTGTLFLAGGLGMIVCAAIGLFSGIMITVFAIPPFIVTLAMMLVGSGFAYLLSHGESIYQVPEAFLWLGRGTVAGALPNSVILMCLLYGLAHGVMTRTVVGRYVYAVGGNREASRFSGVPVVSVLIFVYGLSGLLAGLGGIITASQLKSGSPNYGAMYELYVVAAVVVGGTSLSGGRGTVLGTWIGAFIIAVIQNGMNLMGVESYTQKVVLGLVILGAVLLDRMKRGRMPWGKV